MASSTSNERSSLLGGQGTTNIPDNLSTPVVYGTETRTDGVLEQTVVPGGGTHMHGTTPDVTVIGRPTLFWAVAISTMFSSCLHLVFYANMGMLFKKKDEDKTFLLYVLSCIVVLGSLFLQPLAAATVAPLTRAYGLRTMYLASIAGIGLSAFAMSISPWSAWLLVSRLLQIVSASLICPLSIAIISVNYKHSIRASRIGILLGLRTISQFIAPLAVFLPLGLIPGPDHQRGRYEWRLWFLGAMIISAALFAALYQVLPTSRAPDSEGSTLPSAPDRRLAWMSPSTTFAALYRCRAAFIVSVVSAPMFGAVFEGFRIYCRDDPKIWSVHQWQAAIYRGLSGPVFPEEFVVAAFSLFVYELGSAVGDVFIGFVLDRLARHSSPEAGSTNRLTGGFFPSLVLVPACFAVIVYCHPVSGEFFLGWVFILGIGIHSILGVGIVFVAEADPKRAVELLSAREVIQLGPGIVFSLLVLCFNQRQSLIFGSALAILLSLVVFATFWKLVRVGSGPPTSVSISSSDGDGAQIAPAPSS